MLTVLPVIASTSMLLPASPEVITLLNCVLIIPFRFLQVCINMPKLHVYIYLDFYKNGIMLFALLLIYLLLRF